jgi:hypothetical protein
MVLMVSPSSAQTRDEILADGQAEAIQVISTSTRDVYTIIIGALVALVGIVTVVALRFVYRSTPEWAHTGMIALADKALTVLQQYADNTQNNFDDKIVQAIRTAFDQFLTLQSKTDDEPPKLE